MCKHRWIIQKLNKARNMLLAYLRQNCSVHSHLAENSLRCQIDNSCTICELSPWPKYTCFPWYCYWLPVRFSDNDCICNDLHWFQSKHILTIFVSLNNCTVIKKVEQRLNLLKSTLYPPINSFTHSRNQYYTHSSLPHLLVPSFSLSLAHSFIHFLPPSLPRSLARPSVRQPARPFVRCHSFIHSFIHSLPPSLARPFIHSFIHTHSFIHSLSLCVENHAMGK